MHMSFLNTRKSTRALTIAAALAIAPAAAFAQDAGTTAPSRFNATLGYAHMVPKSNPGTLGGSEAKVGGQGAATLSGTWMVNDNVGVELWGTPDKFHHDVNLANGARGSVKSQPIAVSGQYHFGQASQPIRPFVGLGYYESNIDSEHLDSAAAVGQHVGFGSPKGAMATAGADFNVTDRWFARADARYMRGGSDVTVGGAPAGKLQLDPWLVGLSLGTRF